MNSSRIGKARAFPCQTNTYFCRHFDCLKHLTMKKLLFLLPVLMLVMAACSNEFDVAAPWKEIPVAYAILSPRDTAHYVRVEKAFLDPDTDALQIAQIADSLYYPENEIAVYLQPVNSSQLYQLRRVDGALEGHPRKDGIFAKQPNWLYKINASELTLMQGEKYRLVIKRTDGRPDITAETTIPGDFFFRKPDQTLSPPVISFTPPSQTIVEWRCDANSALFQIVFDIQYREENANGTLIKRDTLIWNAPFALNIENLGGSANFRGEGLIAPADLYRFLKENIDSVANPPFRYFDDISITLVGGGKEIKDFQTISAANLGITGAEVLPSYTNLSEGYGIFTSKNIQKLNGVRFTNPTVDSIGNNSITRHLNFRR